MSELLPCPFCGGEDISVYCVSRVNDVWYVSCEECLARTCDKGKAQAIEAWNMRAGEDE